MKIAVALADEHKVVRGGLKALLNLQPDVEVVAEASDGEELLRAVDTTCPDVVITEIAMHGMDGFAVIRQLRTRCPPLPVLVLSMHDTADLVRRAFTAGASGYLLKDSAPQELADAVRKIFTTGRYLNASVMQLLRQSEESAAHDGLTDRQVEILVLVASGLSSKEIANKLRISAHTVHVHRARIMERLRLHDVASLTRYALRAGLLGA